MKNAAAYDNPDFGQGFAIDAPVDARAAFIKNTYLHLLGAVLIFIALEFVLIQTPGIEGFVLSMVSGYAWLVVLGLVWVAHMMAENMMKSASTGAQYAALGIMIVAYSVMGLPMIYFAAVYGGPNVIPTAGFATAGIFAALTAVVFITRKDFSFMRGAIMLGTMIAMGLIVTSIIFQFDLGMFFTIAMIGLLSLFVLYDTSNVLHHYRTDQHVAASVALFSSVIVLFLYVLRLVMAARD